MNETKKYNRLVVRNIFIPPIIILTGASILNYEEFTLYFYLGTLIPTIIIMSVFEINKNYLISLINKEDFLIISYYNFLDKIVTEEIEKSKVIELKKKNNSSKLKLEMTDNRILNLHVLKDKKNTIANIS